MPLFTFELPSANRFFTLRWMRYPFLSQLETNDADSCSANSRSASIRKLGEFAMIQASQAYRAHRFHFAIVVATSQVVGIQSSSARPWRSRNQSNEQLSDYIKRTSVWFSALKLGLSSSTSWPALLLEECLVTSFVESIILTNHSNRLSIRQLEKSTQSKPC